MNVFDMNAIAKAGIGNADNSIDGTVEYGYNDTYDMPVEYTYAYAHETLVVGNTYNIVYNTTNSRWQTLEAATGSAWLGVATATTASGSVAKLITKGPVEDLDLTSADTVVAGDYLEVITAVQTANCDGTSGSTVPTPRSFAIALTAGASNLCDALLFGERVDIAGS